MSLEEKLSQSGGIQIHWMRFLIRGGVMLTLGVLLVLLTLSSPDVVIFHGHENSWLPICSFILLLVGIVEFMDAFLSKDAKDFFLSLQTSLLDVVVAILILFTVGHEPIRLSLLIAGFLMVKGGFRMILSFAVKIPHLLSARIGAAISIVLGVLIAMQSGSSTGAFLSLCLSLEIAQRGWMLIMFGLGLKQQHQISSQ